MNTPQAVSDAHMRLTEDSLNRLMAVEVAAETAKLRGENETLKLAMRELETRLLTRRNRNSYRLHRAGKMMVVIGLCCGIVGIFAGYFLRAVLMQ